jgi:hypothetical protein
MAALNLPPPDAAAGAVVIKSGGGTHIHEPATYDVELAELQSDLHLWLDALRGPVQQLINDAESIQGRDNSMLALQVAVDRFNAALKVLTEAVYRREPA